MRRLTIHRQSVDVSILGESAQGAIRVLLELTQRLEYNGWDDVGQAIQRAAHGGDLAYQA